MFANRKMSTPARSRHKRICEADGSTLAQFPPAVPSELEGVNNGARERGDGRCTKHAAEIRHQRRLRSRAVCIDIRCADSVHIRRNKPYHSKIGRAGRLHRSGWLILHRRPVDRAPLRGQSPGHSGIPYTPSSMKSGGRAFFHTETMHRSRAAHAIRGCILAAATVQASARKILPGVENLAG